MSVPAPSFNAKLLRVTFTLGQGQNSFQGTGGNQLILTGLRTLATISGALNFLSQMDLRVYGMKAQDMNSLSVISGVPGFPTSIGQNEVLLEGSVDAGQSWFTLFDGLIIEGGPEYRGMPEVFYHCQAMPKAYLPGKQPAPQPLSYPNGATVSDVASTIATSLGTTFQNNGVTTVVAKGAYFDETPIDQLTRLKTNSGPPPYGGFDYTIDPSNTLVITPPNSPRQGNTQIVFAPGSGLIGYPTIEQLGIGVVVLFDPALLLATRFQVSGSDIPAANGIWMPYDLTYQLEQLQFGGQWFASMHCLAVL